MIDALKVSGIWNRRMVVKAVLVTQSVALISHAMHTPANVIARQALVVRHHVIHASRAIMVSRRADANVRALFDFNFIHFPRHILNKR